MSMLTLHKRDLGFGTYRITQESLCICVDLPEPLLFVYTKNCYERRLKPNYRTLALLDMSALAFIRAFCAHMRIIKISDYDQEHCRPTHGTVCGRAIEH